MKYLLGLLIAVMATSSAYGLGFEDHRIKERERERRIVKENGDVVIIDSRPNIEAFIRRMAEKNYCDNPMDKDSIRKTLKEAIRKQANELFLNADFIEEFKAELRKVRPSVKKKDVTDIFERFLKKMGLIPDDAELPLYKQPSY